MAYNLQNTKWVKFQLSHYNDFQLVITLVSESCCDIGSDSDNCIINPTKNGSVGKTRKKAVSINPYVAKK